MRRTRSLMFVLLAMPVLLGGCSFLQEQAPPLTNWEPAMSPDGTRLAYESVVGEDFELFLRDLSSGAVRQLTDNDDDDWSPSWSSDGTHIAFTSNRGKNVDIYVLDLETSDTVRLTVDKGDDVYPFWGIDDRIYFNSNRSEVWEIYAISPDGAGLIKITETPKE